MCGSFLWQPEETNGNKNLAHTTEQFEYKSKYFRSATTIIKVVNISRRQEVRVTSTT
jgi:hypothetical protein